MTTPRNVYRVRAFDATGTVRQSRLYAIKSAAVATRERFEAFYPFTSLEQSVARVDFQEVDELTVADDESPTITTARPYRRRCPECGALAIDADVTHRHRPPCPWQDTDPAEWPS